MQEMKLTIPQFGFRIETREKKIDRDTAPTVLTPAKQQKITQAVCGDDDVTLTKHVVVCSACGKEVPAYASFVGYKEENFISKPRMEIEQWTSRQLSLFGEQPKTLRFNTPLSGITYYVCPHCGVGLNPSEHALSVIVRTDKSKIKIMRALEPKDYFSLTWAKEIQAPHLNLYEAITFNLGNGHTFVSLENEAGEKYAVRDISNIDLQEMRSDPIVMLLRFYKPVYREIKRFFSRFWSGKLPFSPRELNLEKYILLTKFVGYDRDFYNAIPFSSIGNCIERSFMKSAKRLHKASGVPRLLESSLLPNIKTVRKTIFTNPALLFYQKELEIFWQILNDPNHFRTFLGSRILYRELSRLRKFPRMAEFYREVACAIGLKGLWRYLFKGNDYDRSYAMKYLLLNENEKKIERKMWTGAFFAEMTYEEIWNIGSVYSVPIPPQDKTVNMPDCQIGEYSFARLCSSKEYVEAGEQLQNCLGEWQMFGGMDVYGVLKGNQYVAAIAVKDGVIKDARVYRNSDIKRDKPLFSAYCAWIERTAKSMRVN